MIDQKRPRRRGGTHIDGCRSPRDLLNQARTRAPTRSILCGAFCRYSVLSCPPVAQYLWRCPETSLLDPRVPESPRRGTGSTE